MTVTSNKSGKRKVRILVGILLLSIVLVIMFGARWYARNQVVDSIKLVVEQTDNPVIVESRIMKRLSADPASSFKGKKVKAINIANIEKLLTEDRWVKSVEAFINNNNDLQLDIVQNDPVARVFFKDGRSVYLDEEGHLLPLDIPFPYSAPVFSNVPTFGKDKSSQVVREGIVAIGKLIVVDSFWNAMITQINVRKDYTFDCRTLLGEQTVLIGEATNLNEKLHNLFSFYQKGLKQIGFKQYTMIDLRFKGQVVASPAIGYKAPEVTPVAPVAPPDDEGKEATSPKAE